MKLIRKSLGQLIKEKYDFFIPDYQRGYKWTRIEVLKLLNDIWDFKLNHGNDDDSDFYCLQPVVVKPKDGKYYVVTIDESNWKGSMLKEMDTWCLENSK